MVKEDLCITIPSLFRCPISLDVMKSPVSLCTGVTYDRSNIQRWLDNGNNTCPATMQILQSKEIVPNRTLQRLIRLWSDSVCERVNSDEFPAENSVPSKDQVVEIIRDIESMNLNRLDSLSKFVRFAEESEENRKFLAKLEGFLPMLVRFLDNVDGEVSVRIEFLEQVVRISDLVLSKLEDSEQLKNLMFKSQSNCLASLLLVLQQGSTDSKIASVRVLQSVAIDAESKLLIAGKDGLITELVTIIMPENDQALIEAGLSCLISISIPRRIKIKLAQLGAIKIFSKLLSESNSSISISEKVLKLLETVSSCKEGRSEICEDPVCVPAILQKALKVSFMATEHAVTILWSVCYLSRDQKAQEAVTKANGLTKILLLMQSNCSPAIRQMSADLLKIFRVNSKSCLSCYDTKTTHIMPF
ncbi:RING-type E3 ubiquitin transferase [Quillaja saponaria]|uniref:U-box domain-containing protein n=1 Tax=Quillaja saponaria TaxID=32244 RepID=A0AAD7KUA0_QUISA|nr:RING-type E3 ubiquitin transferase [Quillaja saponaria]